MEQGHIYYCIGCNETHSRRDFYTSFNSTHQNGTYPFCKDFIKKTVYLPDKVSVDIEKISRFIKTDGCSIFS